MGIFGNQDRRHRPLYTCVKGMEKLLKRAIKHIRMFLMIQKFYGHIRMSYDWTQGCAHGLHQGASQGTIVCKSAVEPSTNRNHTQVLVVCGHGATMQNHTACEHLFPVSLAVEDFTSRLSQIGNFDRGEKVPQGLALVNRGLSFSVCDRWET